MSIQQISQFPLLIRSRIFKRSKARNAVANLGHDIRAATDLRQQFHQLRDLNRRAGIGLLITFVHPRKPNGGSSSKVWPSWWSGWVMRLPRNIPRLPFVLRQSWRKRPRAWSGATHSLFNLLLGSFTFLPSCSIELSATSGGVTHVHPW